MRLLAICAFAAFNLLAGCDPSEKVLNVTLPTSVTNSQRQRGNIDNTLIATIYGEPREHVELAWGVVRPGSYSHREIIIANETAEPVEVEKLRASCGCTKPEMIHRVIPPGGRCTMNVSLHVSKEGLQKSRVYVHLVDGKSVKSELIIDLLATVSDGVSINLPDPVIVIPASSAHESITASVFVLDYESSIRRPLVTLAEPWVIPGEIEPVALKFEDVFRSCWRVPLVIDCSQVPFGRNKLTIKISDECASYEEQQILELHRPFPIQVSPRAMFFGVRRCNDVSEAKVIVQMSNDFAGRVVQIATPEPLVDCLVFVTKQIDQCNWEITGKLGPFASPPSFESLVAELKIEGTETSAIKLPVSFRIIR